MEKEKSSFLVGYRKFVIALWWLLLATFASVVVLLGISPKRADVTTFGLWVVGTAGFFSSIFVGGNAVEHFNKFWQVSTKSQMTQQDSRREEESKRTEHLIQETRQPPRQAIQGLKDED